MNSAGKFEEGKAYVINIPPGWILVGTVVGQDEEWVTFKDVSYLEKVNEPYDCMGGVAGAKDAKAFRRTIPVSYKWPNQPTLRKSKIAIFIECECDAATLTGPTG